MTSTRPAQNTFDDLTALSEIQAFVRYLKLNSKHSFNISDKEIALAKHFIEIAIQEEPSYARRIGEEVVRWSPFLFQSLVFNYLIYGYDALKIADKQMLRKKIEEAISEKQFTRVIFIGKKYNTDAIILSDQYKANPIKFYELDDGAARDHKIKALRNIPSEMGFNPLNIKMDKDHYIFNNNFYYLKCDLLKDDILKTLQSADPEFSTTSEKTLVIADNLTSFSKDDLKNILAAINKVLKRDDECVISFLSEVVNPKNIVRFVNHRGFDVIEKSYPEDRLKSIGDPHANLYEKKAGKNKVNYFTLRKDADVDPRADKNVNEVPTIGSASESHRKTNFASA